MRAVSWFYIYRVQRTNFFIVNEDQRQVLSTSHLDTTWMVKYLGGLKAQCCVDICVCMTQGMPEWIEIVNELAPVDTFISKLEK